MTDLQQFWRQNEQNEQLWRPKEPLWRQEEPFSSEKEPFWRQHEKVWREHEPFWRHFGGRRAHRSLLEAKGAIWEAKSAPKRNPKRSKIEAKNQEATKNDPRRSWTRLGAILGRFGAPSWVKKRLKPFVLNGFVNNHFFEDKTVRRRFWDQPWPTKAPK